MARTCFIVIDNLRFFIKQNKFTEQIDYGDWIPTYIFYEQYHDIFSRVPILKFSKETEKIRAWV